MTLTLLLDEDVPRSVAPGLRQRGVDAVSVYERDRANRRVSDEDQLELAASEHRAIVTYNRADFQELDHLWGQQRRPHAGIIWCSERSLPRRNVGALIRALEHFARERSDLSNLCLPLGS